MESSVLAVPAAGVALLCTFATAWGFPRLVTSTMPAGAEVISQILVPFDPDMRVLTVLVMAGWLAALLAGFCSGLQGPRPRLVGAPRGGDGSGGGAPRGPGGVFPLGGGPPGAFLVFPPAPCC